MANDRARPDDSRKRSGGLDENRADSAADPVDEASDESFPASDPPAWEPLHSGPPTDLDRDQTSD